MSVTRRPKVGLVLAFTGHYDSVQLLYRFLRHVGFEVVTSKASTPAVIETGAALASADYCFPVRVYVGHVHALTQAHPDLDAILAPNVWRERPETITCSKYRDIGGIAMRSLEGVVPYLEGLAKGRTGLGQLPRLVRPNIGSLTYEAMRNIAFDVYAEVLGLPALTRLGFFLPLALRSRLAPHLMRVEAAFRKAWQEFQGRPRRNLSRLLGDASRPRLAVVGRRYLVEDRALTADLKPWFERRGAVVLTSADVPWDAVDHLYQRAEGYYDTHREGQVLIDWAADQVDGFIVLGSFGCHPDAFQVDYLADYARAKGKPAWTFRFDETVGTAGFQTRFETIYGFLERQRDDRLGLRAGAAAAAAAQAVGPPPPQKSVQGAELRPFFVWPYMGEELNLMLEELLVQLGLRDFSLPPKPIDSATIDLGNRRYAESCSPFACATGSLMETVQAAVTWLREEARREGREPEPRRILSLMLRGEGPCTFGWYAIAQNHHLPGDLGSRLEDGHSLELMTMGLSNAVVFLHQLTRLGDSRRLAPVVAYVEAHMSGTWRRLTPLTRTRLTLRFQLAVRSLLGPVWAKLHAAERLRARYLLVKAHEVEPGSAAEVYRAGLALLHEAHEKAAVRQALRRGLSLLNRLPQDRSPRPRVVSVGEIYVALTSFANRGVVENLLGREGIEVVEGISLSGFIHHTLREMKRRGLANHPWVKPLRLWLAARNIRWLEQRPRDLRARPWLEWEVGGEGMPGVAAALRLIERGCDGIIHTFPFKCMPEGIAKDAYRELSAYYGVRYLSLSFDKELDNERVKTEVATFAALLHAQAFRGGWLARLRLRLRRLRLGWRVARLYTRARHPHQRGRGENLPSID